MSNNFRPVYEQPIYKIIIEVRDLSLDKAIPQFAAAIDAQIDCDEASDDFINEKLHSLIRSSSVGSMTRPYGVCASGPQPHSSSNNPEAIARRGPTPPLVPIRHAQRMRLHYMM
jgi:hypothetical protein